MQKATKEDISVQMQELEGNFQNMKKQWVQNDNARQQAAELQLRQQAAELQLRQQAVELQRRHQDEARLNAEALVKAGVQLNDAYNIGWEVMSGYYERSVHY